MSTQVHVTAAAEARRVPLTDLAMLLVVVIWGANFSMVKVALNEMPPLGFTALRFASGAVLLLAIVRLREGPVRLPAGSLWQLVWLGFVGNTLYQICFIIGISRTTAANSALLLATMPVMVALFGALLGLERLTRNMLGGIAIAFCGIVLVMVSRGAVLSWQTLGGDALILVGVFFWAAYTLGLRTVENRLSSLRLTALTMLTGTPGLVLAGGPELLRRDWGSVSAAAWGGLAYSVVLALVVAYLVWNNSVRAVGGSRTAIYTCVTPIIAVAVAWPVLGERPTPLQAVGAVLIIIGILLARR